MTDSVKTEDVVTAGLVARPQMEDGLLISGWFHAELVRDGEVIWEDDFPNVVTTVGKNDMLDKYLAGSAYTQTIVMGLKGTGSAVAGDTQASHAGWLEQGLANAPTYSGTRKTPAFSAASAGAKTTSAAVAFSITSTGTVFGCFLNNGGSSTIDNTTGVLFSAGDFTGGSRAVINGDTLNVTYTLTLT